ncbi:MAG: DUF3300 domain-containing protein [Lacunisphaera sp.]|nr:DUF3300 domain-containing protein [Lacunisphaera sp.]
MKNLRSAFLVILGLLACGRIAAADPEPREPLTPKQIEELVSPIALYPDPLVALILPAATRPSDIVLAERFLTGGGDPEKAATEPWDDSIKALVRYREVIDYLDENLAWTRSLGESFLDQPVAVMNAIQAVRARARAAGLLKDTSEQEVVVESDEIRIVPANPTVIYVPRYDPEILYVSSYSSSFYPGPFLSFGIGYGIGAWLSYDCDWRYRSVRIAHRPAHWYHQPDWRGRYPHHPAGPTTWQRWAPPPRHDRRFDRPTHSAGPVLHPSRPRGMSAPASPGRVGGNTPRNERLNPPPRQQSSAMVTPDVNPTPANPGRVHRAPPSYQRPAEQAPSPRVRNDSAASPRRDHGNPPSARPPQGHTPPPPRVSAPPPERPQPSASPRPAEPRGDTRDRSPDRHRGDDNEKHLR